MPSLSQSITYFGIIIVLHSAYSCLHYRSILTSTTVDIESIDPSKPPHDVVIECMLGFILCLLGQISDKGDFLPVMGEGRKEVRAPAHVGRDFDIFTNREGILSQVKSRRAVKFEKWEDDE